MQKLLDLEKLLFITIPLWSEILPFRFQSDGADGTAKDGVLSGSENEALFHTVDTDGNGKLDLTEFRESVRQVSFNKFASSFTNSCTLQKQSEYFGSLNLCSFLFNFNCAFI